MNTPHRTLRCARCGAAPLWIINAAPDALLEPVCARCATGFAPEPPPANAMPLPLPRVPAERARGSSIPTPLALAAVFVAAFLPQAAVMASSAAQRAPRAIRAALSALDEGPSSGELGPIAARTNGASARRAPQPMIAPPRCASVIAMPLSPAVRAPSGDEASAASKATRALAADDPLPIDRPEGLWVTRALLARLRARTTLREGDLVTHVNGVPVFSRVPPRTCTGGDRYVRFSVVRGGLVGNRYASCAPSALRVDVAQPRREVAMPAAALLTGRR